MRSLQKLNSDDSNQKIKQFISDGNPFLVSRVGLGGETAVSALTLSGRPLPQNVLQWFYVNAGFYGSSDFERYAQLYKSCLENSELVAYWDFPGFQEYENFLVPEGKTLIDIGSLESFRFDNPWTESLKGKRILIINPFESTIQSQLKNKNLIWKNPNVLPDADWITYKSVQSIGGKGPHRDWYESFDIMCQDISKIDFDFCMLGCGSYGLPLSNFIRKDLNKSAIYVGGGLQLYFGILGKRWESGDLRQHINPYWTRPQTIEKPEFGDYVEGGCYW